MHKIHTDKLPTNWLQDVNMSKKIKNREIRKLCIIAVFLADHGNSSANPMHCVGVYVCE